MSERGLAWSYWATSIAMIGPLIALLLILPTIVGFGIAALWLGAIAECAYLGRRHWRARR